MILRFFFLERESEKMEEKITQMELEKLTPFKNHPFQVRQDEELEQLKESISQYGVLTPLIVRPMADGTLEIISGHRRKLAAELLGLEKVPTIIRDLSEEEAVVLMVDSNIQRENLLPSEKAFAYRMKMEALKHQGKRTLDQVEPNWSAKEIGKENNESMSQVKRYIRLTFLIAPILEMVDQKRISFSPAVALSYLRPEEQYVLIDMMRAEDCTPSLSQSIRLKKASQREILDEEMMLEIMSEPKANQKEQLKLPMERIKGYFPKDYSPEQMEQTIIKLLQQLERKRKNQQER